MLPKHIKSVIPCYIFTADKQMKLVDMADIQARHVRQHGHGGGHVKGNNKSVSLIFSLPVASVCLPVVSSSGAEERSLKKKPDFFFYLFIFFTI